VFTSPYFALFLFFLATAGFLIFLVLLSIYLGPKNPTRTKQLPFECGSVSIGDVRSERFFVRFYLVAMVFLLFDIEVLFMYPWAIVLRDLGWVALLEMAIFSVVLLVGLAYIWRRGVLDWNKH
jgi:NADH-quinone oxidoreductase subunit A